ncbi:MAG: hypothetical protein ABSE49_33780 [Polyangiaceae bacterium]
MARAFSLRSWRWALLLSIVSSAASCSSAGSCDPNLCADDAGSDDPVYRCEDNAVVETVTTCFISPPPVTNTVHTYPCDPGNECIEPSPGQASCGVRCIAGGYCLQGTVCNGEDPDGEPICVVPQPPPPDASTAEDAGLDADGGFVPDAGSVTALDATPEAEGD